LTHRSAVKEAEHVASLLFLQYLLPQAQSAKEIHEAMENQQRNQKRLKSTGMAL
jgi:penicillin V acylase-like amidase (Ntn superfamily)